MSPDKDLRFLNLFSYKRHLYTAFYAQPRKVAVIRISHMYAEPYLTKARSAIPTV